MNSKVKSLCEEYISLVQKINYYKGASSTDTITAGSNYYALGSAYRAIYGVMVKLSYEGYVQVKQLNELMEQYRNEYGTSIETSLAVGKPD